MTPDHRDMNVGHQTESSLTVFFREYVLTPLSTAETVVEAEREEVHAERRAWARFKERIAGIETVSTSRSTPTTRTYRVEGQNRGRERTRAAYRETVMSVDHYDELYGETLEEHAAAELSADIAAGLRREATTPFSEWYKTALTAAVETTIAHRERFSAELDAEAESLAASKPTLDEILSSCEGPRIPAGRRADFEDQLEEVARERQEVIQQRTPLSRTDGHDLCRYLYHDQEWTYPVLTAVARLRNAVA